MTKQELIDAANKISDERIRKTLISAIDAAYTEGFNRGFQAASDISLQTIDAVFGKERNEKV